MRKSVKAARRQAQAEGWSQWIRTGPGEESDERALAAGCRFDLARAEHACQFFQRYVTLTEGAFSGQQFSLLEWQRDFVGRLFGWVRYSAEWKLEVRRFRYAYLEVPKKNGKTPLLAGIGLYLLLADAPDRQVNCYLAATTRKQAERAIMHAVRAVRVNPDLEKLCTIKKLEGFHTLQYNESSWQVVAADPDSADGVNGHCLADEFHRWRGFEFTNTLRWMIASQPEGVFCAITTAGSEMESPCRHAHDKTQAVNSGRQVDQSWLGTIYAAGEDDDPHSEGTWRKANPSLGTDPSSPLKLESFRADHDAAWKEPSQWAAFMQLRLNRWRTAQKQWIDIEAWDAGSQARKLAKKRIDCFEKFDPTKLKPSQRGACFVGLDCAAVWDTTAAAFLICDTETETIRVAPFYWLPRATAESLAGKVPYREWADAGFLKLTDGEVVDYDAILEDLVTLIEEFSAKAIFYDPLFQAEYLTQRIEAATGCARVEFRPTVMHFAPAVQTAERLISSKSLRHNGHPVLTWQIGNTQMKSDPNGNQRPIKQTAKGRFRSIDGVVAMLMAVQAADLWEPGEEDDDDDNASAFV